MSVQQNMDKLVKAWTDEGRTLPLLYPLETVELVQFAERLGISNLEMLEVMRVLVENGERAFLAADWSRAPRA